MTDGELGRDCLPYLLKRINIIGHSGGTILGALKLGFSIKVWTQQTLSKLLAQYYSYRDEQCPQKYWLFHGKMCLCNDRINLSFEILELSAKPQFPTTHAIKNTYAYLLSNFKPMLNLQLNWQPDTIYSSVMLFHPVAVLNLYSTPAGDLPQSHFNSIHRVLEIQGLIFG